MKFNRNFFVNAGVLFIFVLAIAYMFFSFKKEQIEIVQSKKTQFINQDFLKKKTEIERLFSLTYQSLRTVSLLPSIRHLPVYNRKSEKEDVVKSGLFTKEGQLTVQQLYNNLASNVSVSEIYAVMDGFDHAKGDIPFFMYDKINVTGEVQKEDDEKKTADTPEESEEEEYAYYPKVLKFLKEQKTNIIKSDDLDSIPAELSSVLRTCDNAQYKSVSTGNVLDASGFVYSVPIYNFTNQFIGVISAVIRTNVIEAALQGIPMLPITEEDKKTLQTKYKKSEVYSSSKPNLFSLINLERDVFISDRKISDTKKYKEKALNFLKNKNSFDTAYYEKIQMKDAGDWYLYYDLSDAPWSADLKESQRMFFVKLFFALMLCFGFYFIKYLQLRNKKNISEQIVSKISDISDKLFKSTDESEQNSRVLASISSSLTNTTAEMAAAVANIEISAKQNSEIVLISKDVFSQMKKDVTDSQGVLENLNQAMEKIKDSNNHINQLVEIIHTISNETAKINDIVFKTQLLSFNASIEAARAGVHGRGFSVVAEEVSLLAQATGQASNKIASIVSLGKDQSAQLVSENNNRVQEGILSVIQISEVVEKLVTRTNDLSNNIDAIEESSTKQFAGLQQIGSVIHEIEKAAQDNCKIANTSRELGENLKAQASAQKSTITNISQLFH